MCVEEKNQVRHLSPTGNKWKYIRLTIHVWIQLVNQTRLYNKIDFFPHVPMTMWPSFHDIQTKAGAPINMSSSLTTDKYIIVTDTPNASHWHRQWKRLLPLGCSCVSKYHKWFLQKKSATLHSSCTSTYFEIFHVSIQESLTSIKRNKLHNTPPNTRPLRHVISGVKC